MKLSKRQKREAVKIAIGGGLFLAGWAVSALSGLPRVYGLALYAPAYLILGLPIVVKAVKNVLHGNMLDENFLMSIASIGAERKFPFHRFRWVSGFWLSVCWSSAAVRCSSFGFILILKGFPARRAERSEVRSDPSSSIG